MAAAAFAVYLLSNPARQNLYNHFVWQADAWLNGRFAIPWPISMGFPRNDYFRDVLPLTDQPGYGLLPYPPLPAVVVLPLVAIFGLRADAALVAVVVGALNVALAWRLTSRVVHDRTAALLATLFFGFGTVAWYAAMLGSTWFLAHLVAQTCLLLGITAAVDADDVRTAAAGPIRSSSAHGRPDSHPDVGAPAVPDQRSGGGRHPVRRQFFAGILFGAAALARLTTIFGAPFFAFVGGGSSLVRRAVVAGLGAAIPVAVLLGYNLASTGELFNPVYEFIYRTEYVPRPELRNVDWAITDPRYIPQNVAIMLGWLPIVQPECGFSLLDIACPLLRPDPLGMSLLLTSPAYLLAVPAVLEFRRSRLVAGAATAVAAISLVNLAHFSQGWVQFGYRFSNDFAPFALVLVAIGIERLRSLTLAVGLVGVSILVNAWGVYWGVVLRW